MAQSLNNLALLYDKQGLYASDRDKTWGFWRALAGEDGHESC